MKLLFATLAVLFSVNAFAGDSSESGGDLDQRVLNGCIKYAEKQAQKDLAEHFNANDWAGGTISAGSMDEAKAALPNHTSFLTYQCYNMVAEVLELKLGYAPWQK